MRRREHRLIFWVAVCGMLVLHMDPFARGRVDPVVLGWIPRDLGYHLLWITAAAVMTFYLCARVWPDDDG